MAGLGLSAQHAFQSSVHLGFFDELTLVGLSDAFANGGTEASYLLSRLLGT